jgi:hypothetical protein
MRSGPSRPAKRCCGSGSVQDLGPHRVAGDGGLARRRAEIGREAEAHTFRHRREGFVRQQQRSIGIDQHQRHAAQPGRDAARHRDVAAHAQHHIRLAAAEEAEAVGERAQHLEAALDGVLQALAAHAAEIDGVHGDAVLRHQVFLHAVRGTQPAHFPAALAHRVRNRQSGEDVPAGARRHNHQALHIRPPRISTRFS